MYAIIKLSGNQYRVETGTRLEVDHIEAKEGDVISVPALLVVDDQKNVKIGKDAASTQVSVKIASHKLGEKIDVSRFRHKVRHRRHIGVRPHLTVVMVEKIGDEKSKVTPNTAKKTSKKL